MLATTIPPTRAGRTQRRRGAVRGIAWPGGGGGGGGAGVGAAGTLWLVVAAREVDFLTARFELAVFVAFAVFAVFAVATRFTAAFFAAAAFFAGAFLTAAFLVGVIDASADWRRRPMLRHPRPSTAPR